MIVFTDQRQIFLLVTFQTVNKVQKLANRGDSMHAVLPIPPRTMPLSQKCPIQLPDPDYFSPDAALQE